MDAYGNTSPQMCGYYSITTDRNFDESLSCLKYFKLPNVPLDLNKGLDGIRDKPDSYFGEKMDSLLTYIIRNKDHFVRNKDNHAKKTALIPSTKYITYRGVIRKIMCSPYETRSGWCILATKYKGNIYLCQFTSMEKRLAYKNEAFSSKRFSLYGPKFEQYCLSDDPAQMPDTSGPIDGSAQFFCVFKRKLVGRDFLFAGEMDGVVSDTPVNLDIPENYKDLKFIELKVAPLNTSEMNFYKSKCQNAWTQSFLTGVRDVYFGFRDHAGTVEIIKHYDIDTLRRNWQTYLKPTKCFDFLNNFLKLVEDKLENVDCPDTVYEFNYNEKTCGITSKIYKGKTELSLLPNWYLDAVNS